ncbi:MFS general substrate transporter [Xylariaceae sp. FL0016]|nr:MFS general substrate transporter [Xylariaceae sp. FL0016]
MWDIIREASIGQLIRIFNRGLLPYPEEQGGVQLFAYVGVENVDKVHDDQVTLQGREFGVTEKESTRLPRCPAPVHKTADDVEWAWSSDDGSTKTISALPEPDCVGVSTPALPYPIDTTSLSRESKIAYIKFTKQLPDVAISPSPVLIDWSSSYDPACPKNWSILKKVWIIFIISLYTFAVYIGSSLYAPAIPSIQSSFHASPSVAELGIALYCLGYGIGPLLWSPLSEIPRVGRTWIYVATFAAFVVLALGASLVPDDGAGEAALAPLFTLRFLLGLFGSPCLATAGATLEDLLAPHKLAYALSAWSVAATLGPALGPVMSGFAVEAADDAPGRGWRVSQWELFWLSAPIAALMLVGLPETNPDTILHRKARRVRDRVRRAAEAREKGAGDRAAANIVCAADVTHRHLTPSQLVRFALVKPWEINTLDPAVLYTTVFSAILYGEYYSFFESFPLVFGDMYGLGLGASGLPFLVFVPSLAIAVPTYLYWFRRCAEPVMKASPPPLYGWPESRLIPAVIASIVAPVGLFIFAWTANPSISYWFPILGLLIFFTCMFFIYQCTFFYLSRAYPRYSASLFAANDFTRSCFALASILFSRPLYTAMGINGGVSLLGGMSVLCAVGMLALYRCGHRLRAWSRFAQTS